MSNSVEAAEDWPGWLGDHQDLTRFLRREGFVVSLHREVRLLHLLDELRRVRQPIGDAGELARWLSPILSSTPRDQDRLKGLIASYAAQPPEAQPLAETIDEASATGAAASRIERAARPISRQRAILIPSAIAMIAMVITGGTLLWISPFGSDSTFFDSTGPSPIPVAADVSSVDFMAWLRLFLRGIIATLPIAGAFLFILWRRGLPISLRRASLLGEQASTRFDFARGIRALLPPIRFRRVARMFGQHQQLPSNKLHVSDSIQATIRSGGRAELVYGQRPALPEYVVIIERTSRFDHIGILGDVVVERLRAGGVHLFVYSFDQDPRFIRRQHDGKVEAIQDVAGRFIGKRALLITDGSTLVSRSGEPLNWVYAAFEGFLPAIVLTPVPVAIWAEREQALTLAGLAVYPATPVGLEALAAHLASGTTSISDIFASPHESPSDDFVGELELNRERWTSDIEPEKADVRELVLALHSWLGEEGFTLLAALGLFPEIRGDITIAIAEALEPLPGVSFVDGEVLAEIFRLPWLRCGRMPDWLTNALLDQISPGSAERIQHAYHSVLAAAKPAETFDATEITRRPNSMFLVLSRFFGSDGTGTPRERIVWDFLEGRKHEHELPGNFARLLRAKSEPLEWMALAIGALTAVSIFLVGIQGPWHTSLSLGLESGWWLRFMVPVLAAIAMGLQLAQSFSANRILRIPEWTPTALAGSLLLAEAVGIFDREGSDLYARLLIEGTAFLTTVFLRGRSSPSTAPGEILLRNLFAGDRWWATSLAFVVPALLLVGFNEVETLPRNLIDGDISYVLGAMFRHCVAIGIIVACASIRLRLRLEHAIIIAFCAISGRYLPIAYLVEAHSLGFVSLPESVISRISILAWVTPLEIAGAIFGFWRCGRLPTNTARTLLLYLMPLLVGLGTYESTIKYLYDWGFSGFSFSQKDESISLKVESMYVPSIILFVTAFLFRETWPRQRPDDVRQPTHESPWRRMGHAVSDFNRRHWYAVPTGYLLVAAIGHAIWLIALLLDDAASFRFVIGIGTLSALAFWPAVRLTFQHLHSPPISRQYQWNAISENQTGAWILLPALLLLSVYFNIGGYFVDLTRLWLPVAAWLGVRYGRIGFLLTVLAGLPLLVGANFSGLGLTSLDPPGFLFALGTGKQPGLYLCALIVCRLFGQRDYLYDLLGADRLEARSLAFLFLVATWAPSSFMGVYNGVQVNLALHLDIYFYILILMIGLAAAPARPVIILLGFGSALGQLLSAFWIFRTLDGVQYGHHLIGPKSFVTGVVALYVGRLVRSHLLGTAQRRVGVVLGSLMLVLVLASLELQFQPPMRAAFQRISFGTPIAVAMMLFASGFAGGRVGAVAATLVWLAAQFMFRGTPFLFNFEIGSVSGELVVHSTGRFVNTTLSILKGLEWVPLDVMIPAFGWFLANRLPVDLGAKARKPPFITGPAGRTPPPLRFQIMDNVFSVVIGTILSVTVVVFVVEKLSPLLK